MYLVCSLVETGVHSNYPLKRHEFSDKNPRKMKQKHHQQINKFYFIYKSPGPMLVTAENTRNDVQRPINYEKPPKNRRFSYRSATVGLPIVNQSYRAHGRALHCGAQAARQLPSDGSLRLLGVGSCASRFMIPYPNTTISEKKQLPRCIWRGYSSLFSGVKYLHEMSPIHKNNDMPS